MIDPTSILTDTSPQGNAGTNSKSTKGSGSKSKSSSKNSNNTSSDHPQRGQQQRRRRKQEQEEKERPSQQWKLRPKVSESWVELENHVLVLVKLVQQDLPLRLYQFKAAMEAEAVVTKRLYLVKCEYRAPFRSLLESHQNLLRAPPMELVDCYLNEQQKQQDNSSSNEKSSPSSPEDIKAELMAKLKTPELVELLSLEMEAEKLELDMGKALFPFSELARTISHKRISLDSVIGIVELSELPSLRETVRVSFDL